ncbi:NAD(P)-binding protein [Leucogyrophana mollusca]|uniref:NAD(P)-binding protein n=1 Tax=Leucogyrophana mollusca TaxID=85980 RepID=A0ACB8BNS3_9AGAM|nr:NAD(P)-binding protein [Leucogyrophana mollusca]
MIPIPKIWLITGASSGFGRSMAELLLKKGDIVVATLRTPEALSDLSAQYPPDKLLVVKLDVTKKADVTAAFAKAQEVFGRIDVVFNNAGQIVLGEVESLSEESARQLLEVNFWGAAHVSREAVRFFREVNKPIGGRLLQVSSRLGLVGGPASAYYSASKFALEGLSESLSKELDPAWNIKVTIIEPGPFRTKLVAENVQIEPQHPAYAHPSSPSSQFRKYATSSAVDGDADKAVAAIEKIVHIDNPPVRLPLHKKTVASAKEKALSILEDVDNYGAWSEDLYFN